MTKIAILGARGRLGGALLRKWSPRHSVTGFARPEFDLGDFASIERSLRSADFEAVVNCAAQANVDYCEQHPSEAHRLNAGAPAVMARLCNESGTRFLHISTDYVFDGTQHEPITEDVPPSPISVYGASKAEGDAAVLAANPSAFIARVSWVFGPEKPSFIDMILKQAMERDTVSAIGDKWSSPTYTDDLASWLETLIVGADARRPPPAPGLYHLCNRGGCTWREYGEFALECAAGTGIPLKTTRVAAQHLSDMKMFIARRPVHTVLSTAKFEAATGLVPAPWRDAVRRYIAKLSHTIQARS